MADGVSLAIATARIRWAGVALGLAQTSLINPPPISRGAMLAVTAGIALYNLPVALCRRLPRRWVAVVVAFGLIGDFLASTAWLLLNARDVDDTTLIVFVAVALEAAIIYGWLGSLVFLAAFAGGLGLRFWEITSLFGSAPPIGSYILRSFIVLIVAGFGGAITSEISRLRRSTQESHQALAREDEALHEEMTNRQQAEDALRASEERLRTIVRNAPVMLFALDRQGVITFSDGTGLASLGNKPHEPIGFSVWELYAHDPDALDKIKEALSGKSVQTTVEEAGRSFALHFAPFDDNRGAIAGVIGVSLDITDRKQAERALREQRDLYQAFLEAQSDLGDLVIVSEEGQPPYANPAVSRITGYSPEELSAMSSFNELVPSEERQALMDQLVSAGAAGGPHRFETTIIRKDGQRIDLEAAQITLRMGERTRVFTSARDITDRKRVADELRKSFEQLRQVDHERRALLSRLVRVQEEERAKIAGDIHDDSIQTMYAVKIRLHLLHGKVQDPQLLQLLSQLDLTIEHAIDRLRHLLFDLRPALLDEEGLIPALRAYLDAMRSETGIEYKVESDLQAELPADVRVIAYRIAQEALTNVRKHAGASQVEISLREQDGGLHVRTRDNGKGFAEEQISRPRPGHLGLVAMRQRAEMVGGWLRVSSTPGEGTVVEFWIPAQTTAVPEAA